MVKDFIVKNVSWFYCVFENLRNPAKQIFGSLEPQNLFRENVKSFNHENEFRDILRT